MTKDELRSLWQELFEQPAPDLRKNLMTRLLAYRLQELAHRGLSRDARLRLRQLFRLFDKDPTAVLPNVPSIKPGTRMVRAWQRQVHTVTVLEDGFEYAGNRYASLSQIARLITGTRWSGPAFFGINRARKGSEAHGR